MENRINYTELLNKKIASITGDNIGSEELRFLFSDGSQYKFHHQYDCCETVEINDIDGNLQDFVGKSLILAEEYISQDNKPSEYSESWTWTFYRFQDETGNLIVVRWLGESNGYYSESVNFEEIDPPTNFKKPYLKEFYDKVGEYTNSNSYETSLLLSFKYFYPHLAQRLESYENPTHEKYNHRYFQYKLDELFLGE